MTAPLIMLVEDNLRDLALTRRAFSKQGIEIPLVHASDGQEALDMLLDPASPLPSLILLDLNMPRMDGIELLNAMRDRPELRWIPAVMLTTSTRTEDVERAYGASANSYIVKPVDLQDFQKVVELLRVYWTETVVLPDPRRRTDASREAA